MADHIDVQDAWVQAGYEVVVPSELTPEMMEKVCQGWETPSRSLYDMFGTNEPYVELVEDVDWNWNHDMLLKLIPGPSTNFYVGPQEKHYTIPKHLLYHFSDFSKKCLESSFLEGDANAVWLRDVDPHVFQYLWQWLYTGELIVDHFPSSDWNLSRSEKLMRTCKLLCRVHMLGERLLFDYRFLEWVAQEKLDEIIGEAKTGGECTPLAPEVVEEVLSGSAPVRYEHDSTWGNPTLRPFVLRHTCGLRSWRTIDFMDYTECFQIDGAFAAEIMIHLANDVKWAQKRLDEQVGWPVDVFEEEEQAAEGLDSPPYIETWSKPSEAIWVLLRRICTSAAEGSTLDLRAFSNLFEVNGAFAASFMNHMTTELLLIAERWGVERGEKVDLEAEKEEEERQEQEKRDLDSMVQRIIRRDGWS